MKKLISLFLLILLPFVLNAQTEKINNTTIISGGKVDTILVHLDNSAYSSIKKFKYNTKNQQFEVAGNDGVWHAAQSVFSDNENIKIWCDEVQHPSQVRYVWNETTIAAIQKSYGLCSMPFTVNIVRKPTIYSIGDSTMANKGEGTQECGWGQVLNEFLSDEIIVDNRAMNGRSSKSFIDEGRWKAILDVIKPGDYVFIQFGHNDEKPDEKRHTDANTTFKDNLRKFITEAQAKGAQPVLFNSMIRRKFDENGKLTNTHGEYIKAPFEVAEEMGVPYVDAESLSKQLVEPMGPEESKKLFMWFPPKKQDDTHLNHTGARKMSKLFLDAAAEVVPSLKKYMK